MEAFRKKIILLCDALSDAIYLGMPGNEHLVDKDTDDLAKALFVQLEEMGKQFKSYKN